MSFLNHSTATRRQRAGRTGHSGWERPSVRRQLGQKKTAVLAPPGPGPLRKIREAER